MWGTTVIFITHTISIVIYSSVLSSFFVIIMTNSDGGGRIQGLILFYKFGENSLVLWQRHLTGVSKHHVLTNDPDDVLPCPAMHNISGSS